MQLAGVAEAEVNSKKMVVAGGVEAEVGPGGCWVAWGGGSVGGVADRGPAGVKHRGGGRGAGVGSGGGCCTAGGGETGAGSGACWVAAGGDEGVVGNPSESRGTFSRERKVVLGKLHSERGNPERSGEGSEAGVLALGGRVMGAMQSKGRSVGGVGSVGGSGSVRSGVGSGSSCEAGGSITTSGLGGRGGAGRTGTGGRSESKASSSIPMINRASWRREARTETFFRVRWRSTSRVEFRCNAEEILHRTSLAFWRVKLDCSPIVS